MDVAPAVNREGEGEGEAKQPQPICRTSHWNHDSLWARARSGAGGHPTQLVPLLRHLAFPELESATLNDNQTIITPKTTLYTKQTGSELPTFLSRAQANGPGQPLLPPAPAEAVQYVANGDADTLICRHPYGAVNVLRLLHVYEE